MLKGNRGGSLLPGVWELFLSVPPLWCGDGCGSTYWRGPEHRPLCTAWMLNTFFYITKPKLLLGWAFGRRGFFFPDLAEFLGCWASPSFALIATVGSVQMVYHVCDGSVHLLQLCRFESLCLNVFAIKFSWTKPGKVQVWYEGRLWSPSVRSRWKASFFLSASDSKCCKTDSDGIEDSNVPWFSNVI